MGIRYEHITIEERCEISRLRSSGQSIRQVAATLGRSPSTISRELKRNVSQSQGYWPKYADQQAQERRWCGSRLERDEGLRRRVLARLQQGWSPQQVAGRFALEQGRKVISHESIYRFYGQLARTKDYSWRHYLPRAKSKRGWRGRKGGSPASFMAHRRPVAERPQEAADRQTAGHWEADLMLFRTYGQAVLILHERHSRLLIALRLAGKAADPIARAMAEVLAPLPPQLRQTVTFERSSPVPTDSWGFCTPPSSAIPIHRGRKGGSRTPSVAYGATLPRKTDLAELPDDRFTLLIQAYNNTPRKCLGYYTPSETIWNQVLHLKCESTFPPSRE